MGDHEEVSRLAASLKVVVQDALVNQEVGNGKCLSSTLVFTFNQMYLSTTMLSLSSSFFT